MTLHVFVFVCLLVVCILLTLALLWRLDWFPDRAFHLKRLGQARQAHPSAQATHPRRLSRLSTRLPGLVGWSAGPSACATVERGEKPARSRLPASTPRASPVPTGSASTSATPTLESTRLLGDGKHGRAEPIQTFRCQACRATWSRRRDTPFYRLKTPSHQVAMVLAAASRRTGPFCGRTSLWLLSGHYHEVAHSRWRARSELARAVLLPSVAPASPTGRTANQAAQPYAGAVAPSSD
jgi:hypothetical protein